MYKTVGVFGQTKGGTSALAGVVNILGVPMWGREKTLDDTDMVLDTDRTIQRRNEQYDIWGFKNPSLTPRVDELVPKLRNPHILFVLRDPVAIEMSLQQGRADDNKNFLQRLRQFYTWMPSNPGYPWMPVSYEKLVTSTSEEVRNIADFLGCEFRQSAVDFINPGKGYQDASLFT